MKRFLIQEAENVVSVSNEDIPEDVAAYAAELKLLYSVPFSYLVAEEDFLPPESMRFFCVDENWVNALVDGALSIGRNDSGAARLDKAALLPVLGQAKNTIRSIRYRKVHENHRKKRECMNFSQQKDGQSGFLIRSALTRKRKGLEVTGYDGEHPLSILRADMIGTDMLICIFDGILSSVEISEPKTGLRFGAYENDRKIQVKSITEGEDLGKPIPGKSIPLKADENGRLDVKHIAEDLKTALGQEITPSVFAFEMMLAAQKAVFLNTTV